jgi:hypothetical protein
VIGAILIYYNYNMRIYTYYSNSKNRKGKKQITAKFDVGDLVSTTRVTDYETLTIIGRIQQIHIMDNHIDYMLTSNHLGDAYEEDQLELVR